MRPTSVSDHAVLRYLERVLEIDTEAVRKHIHSETETAIAVGAATLKRNGVRYVIVDGAVVTVTLSKKRMAKLALEAK
ncbi:hypothetical protein J7481_19640 [Labrenzia sp. R4_2]|uniref:hypothetical protein n=1 Tax=Labrenzia sp. R4_2 TaxID=2821107 RepID=UPI001ADC84A4|nr:hypothetical protein [Labrenzia sp. R4_2]MBO9421730.1 hypothetical protein [Labrenzia sp. R4_2]